MLRSGIKDNNNKRRTFTTSDFYDVDNPPPRSVLELPPQGFSEHFFVLTSPKADGSTNRDDKFLLLNPFGIPPSRVDWHHEISLSDAKQRDHLNYAEDCGENWCIRKTAELCEAIYRTSDSWCAGQLLATKHHEDDYSHFEKACIDHACYKHGQPYTTDEEGQSEKQRLKERMAVFAEYAKRGTEGFHTSVIGPVTLYDMYQQEYTQAMQRLGILDHVRVYTGSFAYDVNETTTNIIADHRRLYPHLYHENGELIDGGDY